MIKRIHRYLLAGGLTAAVVLAFSPGVTAAAPGDSFVPQPDAPTQEVLSVPSVMQPAYPRSTSVYTVGVAVGSQGTVANISSIKMCWYKESAGLDGCGFDADGQVDPREQWQMTWYNNSNIDDPANADDWFLVEDSYHPDWGVYSNSYQNVGSTSGYGDGTGAAMNIAFKFKISKAMLAGTDWRVRVIAVDANGQESPQTSNPITVLYFGAVAQQRESVNFGNLAGGDANGFEGLLDGNFSANALSSITYAASTFQATVGSTTYEVPLTGGAALSSPGTGKVALDCAPSYYWNPQDALRITATPVTARTGMFGSGTGEYDSSDNWNSCQLVYGGGAPVANLTYENVFTVGIGEE